MIQNCVITACYRRGAMVYFSPLTKRIRVQEICTTESLKISPRSKYIADLSLTSSIKYDSFCTLIAWGRPPIRKQNKSRWRKSLLLVPTEAHNLGSLSSFMIFLSCSGLRIWSQGNLSKAPCVRHTRAPYMV